MDRRELSLKPLMICDEIWINEKEIKDEFFDLMNQIKNLGGTTPVGNPRIDPFSC